MTVWHRVVGQQTIVDRLHNIVTSPRPAPHAWLFTGPPGSGRTTAAMAFAAALQCPQHGCGNCTTCHDITAGTAADVERTSTQGMTLDIATIRDLVTRASQQPATMRYRILLIEDADRMTERTSNVLLKALEEPATATIWLLTAPSPLDVLPTIRSRCQTVSLTVPDPTLVATYLATELGTSHDQALTAARYAQSHVGVARALLKDPTTLQRRSEVTALALKPMGVGGAVRAAKWLVETSEAAADAQLTARNEAEMEELLRCSGVEPGKRVPPALRSQVKKLQDDQKRRVNRSQADAIDRALIDMQSVFRDVLLCQLGADVALINADHDGQIRQLAGNSTPQATLRRLDAIATARRRVTGPVMLNRQLALESMMVCLCSA